MVICSPQSNKWYWPQGIQKEQSAGTSTYHKLKETDVICCKRTRLPNLRESDLTTKRFQLAALLNHQNDLVYSNKSKKGYWIGSPSSTKKSLQPTRYGLWMHFKDWKSLFVFCRKARHCWWWLLIKNSEETSFCNKKIIWWMKVH